MTDGSLDAEVNMASTAAPPRATQTDTKNSVSISLESHRLIFLLPLVLRALMPYLLSLSSSIKNVHVLFVHCCIPCSSGFSQTRSGSTKLIGSPADRTGPEAVTERLFSRRAAAVSGQHRRLSVRLFSRREQKAALNVGAGCRSALTLPCCLLR